MPIGVPHEPLHCRSTIDEPISAPASPATMMPAKAMARAAGDGNAESFLLVD